MKSAKFAVLFGALSLVFMGCPYESKFPVDDPSNAKVDKSMLGKWEETSEDDYKYTITADGSNQYKIEKKKKSGEDEPTKYIGFVSNLGAEVEYLNIYEETESSSSTDRKYYIYKYTKGSDRFKILGVTDNITEEFTSSAELRAFIKKYQDLSFFFDKDEEKKFTREW
jgi:hypothetical protein